MPSIDQQVLLRSPSWAIVGSFPEVPDGMICKRPHSGNVEDSDHRNAGRIGTSLVEQGLPA